MALVHQPTPEQLQFCNTYMSMVRPAVGDKLWSAYLYGAMMFPRPAAWRVDVDFHIILSRHLTDDESRRVRELHQRLAEQDNPLGKELDGYYLLFADAKKREHPQSIAWHSSVDSAWPLHCAHIHAGKFKLLHGEDPRSFVALSSWSDCIEGLNNELGYIKDHPEYPQFGVLNLSRLLHSWQTHDVVRSKYESAQWALKNLDSNWRPAIEAALRDYQEKPEDGDTELLETMLPDFLRYCEAEIGKLK